LAGAHATTLQCHYGNFELPFPQRRRAIKPAANTGGIMDLTDRSSPVPFRLMTTTSYFAETIGD
jgi:hypothetical protein